jgi:hypothetical protein
MKPSRHPLLRYFKFDHLAADLQKASKPFADMAYEIAGGGGDEAMITMALQHLLCAKDAAVRAKLPADS